MLLRILIVLCSVVVLISAAGCAGTKGSKVTPPSSLTEAIRVESTDLTAILLSISGQDEEGTLIENPGWSEYMLEIENHSSKFLTIHNVKILNFDGRYEDFAFIYEQIIAPPNVSVELAGDAAKTAAGVAAGLVISFGGSIF